ncbi:MULTISPECIES: MotA/TolQ/ExbB proton channel family protein [Crateriforma]|uniref:Biopolymer transport protein ExbB n=1 Tax=Crateriforma conspicua TaxID=2527996 RepID=A0A5C6FS52_9PLAN|nr:MULTISPECIES: MotA/TolQ/ExbB proton channel family protein [Crateriforma]QDV65579.1 Biopolymer transport protein ExbB [Crateriforma conspicua]TWT70978.1 Biopolymer transport protein ExbB [Crateriforma conspicua]TWU65086.1 Biopolymer transport protein ExbB [Crateriforma conspicua]
MVLATSLFDIISNSTYLALAAVALWGIYCIVLVWTRVNQKRFVSEDEQDAYLDEVVPLLESGQFDAVLDHCEDDARAIPQMVELAVANRHFGLRRARQIMTDRFQRDVLSDLEYRLSWVGTVIKAAPMIGLFGTVFGMMGAFQTLATAETVEPSALAGDIRVALVTTASGLAIAIPLMILVANVNIRIAKMEDLVSSGVTRFFEAFKTGLSKETGRAA